MIDRQTLFNNGDRNSWLWRWTKIAKVDSYWRPGLVTKFNQSLPRPAPTWLTFSDHNIYCFFLKAIHNKRCVHLYLCKKIMCIIVNSHFCVDSNKYKSDKNLTLMLPPLPFHFLLLKSCNFLSRSYENVFLACSRQKTLSCIYDSTGVDSYFVTKKMICRGIIKIFWKILISKSKYQC